MPTGVRCAGRWRPPCTAWRASIRTMSTSSCSTSTTRCGRRSSRSTTWTASRTSSFWARTTRLSRWRRAACLRRCWRATSRLWPTGRTCRTTGLPGGRARSRPLQWAPSWMVALTLSAARSEPRGATGKCCPGGHYLGMELNNVFIKSFYAFLASAPCPPKWREISAPTMKRMPMMAEAVPAPTSALCPWATPGTSSAYWAAL
mmetsp:Transcript_58895/g.188174  ORF Transcript_58895/g.188174 Transcript_58895/m.188174 type:complete len:203 (-) Transcript_58895:33-641(-)